MRELTICVLILFCSANGVRAGVLVDEVLEQKANAQEPINEGYWEKLLEDARELEAAILAAKATMEANGHNYEDSGWMGNWWGTAPDCAEITNVVGPVISNDLRNCDPSSHLIVQVSGTGWLFGSWHSYFIVITPFGNYLLDPWYYNDFDLHEFDDFDDLSYKPSYVNELNTPIGDPMPAAPGSGAQTTPGGGDSDWADPYGGLPGLPGSLGGYY
mgnify:CR=1 FL=1